jgi:probable HAF family extracellular repeat protein/ELWxxDGT repeat protein
LRLVLVVIDGTTVFSSSFSGQSPYQGTIPFSIAGISVSAGKTIDFVVDSLGTQSYDNVGLKALITETPVTTPTVTSIAAITDNGGTTLSAGHVVTISLALNEAVYVTGTPLLLLNDNEVATYTTGSGTNALTFTYTVQPGDNIPDLQVTGLNLNGGTIQDGAGTTLSGLVQGDLALQIDTTAPTVSVSIDNTDLNVADDTATVTFGFSEAPVSFVLSDTSAVGGTLSNLQQVNGTTYTATFTGAANTDISNASVSVTASSWQEGNGNAGAAASTTAFTVDTVTPTVAVSINSTDVNLANNTAIVTFSFSEAPVAFALADTSAVGGTLSNLQQSDATHYTATFTGAANTDISTASVSVTAGSWQEGNGNAGAGGSTATFTVDTVTPRQIVLFNGADGGLWATNGTTAGTCELTGISGADSAGLRPSYMTVFDGEVLFNGTDASGTPGLWVTNGTTAGTHELTGVTGAYMGGLFWNGRGPYSFTTFNGEVLFGAVDAAKYVGLWVTDGTAAGTHELTGISGTNEAGIFPQYMTVYNGEVLFDGYDASGHSSLWVTNGTAAGTYELTGISGANTGTLGLLPFDLTVFNSEVLFDGFNASGNQGLWVTNGTAAGTHELTGISGAYAGGAFANGLTPIDMTVFNGEVFFRGIDTSKNIGLWVTDGTPAGTHELTGISGANSTGSDSFPAGLYPIGMTVFNGELLFEGQNASGNRGLWVSDGTPAGTHELTGINGAYSGGLFSYNSPDFTILNGQVLFSGADANNDVGLWVTDGTSAGTHELSPNLNPSDLTLISLFVPPSAPTITSVTDDVVPVTGVLTNGATTNDPDLTVKVSLSGTDAAAGDTVQLYNGTGTGSRLGSSYTLTNTDISNSFANVQTGTLADGTTYTLTDRITDAAGNQSAVSADSFTVTEDTTAPTVAVSIDNTDVNVADPTGLVTFAFSEAVASFALSDTSEVGGTLSNLQQIDATHYTAIFTGAANTDISTASVSVTAGSYQDVAGNAGTGGSTTSFTVDTVTPAVAVSIDNTDVNVANGTGTVTFAFSEAPTSFALADTSAVGGTLSNLQQTDATTYTATFTGAANTDISTASVSVTAGSYQDLAGNAGAGGSTAAFTVDTVTPTVVMTTYTYTTLNDPLGTTGTVANGINASGEIVGYYVDSNGTGIGFLYSGGIYTNDLMNPVSSVFIPYGINTSGQIVGFYYENVYPNDIAGLSGWLDNGSTWTRLGGAPYGINASGQIVGRYDEYTLNGRVSHGFLYSGGTYATLDDPSASLANGGTIPHGINDLGQIVGFYIDTNGGQHSFLYSGGNYTLLNDPLATNGLTFAYGINDAGQIVGDYQDATGDHGFLYSGGVYTTFNVPLARDTRPFGINNTGQIVGTYTDGTGHHGFLATPVVTTTPPAITEGLANDTGSSSSDKITSIPTLTGSGDPNAVVHFTVDGNPTLGTATADAGGTWMFTLTGLSDGSHTVVASETDAADNTGTASLTFTLDATAPTITVSIENTDVNVAHGTGTVTFAFSEAPISFSLADTSVVGGTLSNLQQTDPTHYTATFTGAANTDISTASLSVTAASYQDLAGNAGAGGSTASFTVDTVTPTVVVSIDNTDMNVAHGAGTVTFTFSEAPTSFALSDTSAVGGTLSNLQQSDVTHYTATFTGAANTDISTASVSVTAGSWQEDNGNSGVGATSAAFVVDTVTPTVAVSINNTDINVANPTALVTFTFSKAPTDFSLNDVTSTDGSLSNLSGSGTSYTAIFTAHPGVDNSAATVSVTNGSYHDADGNVGVGTSTMSPINFSGAVATFYEVQNDWAPSQMIDGIFTGPPGPGTFAGINGWSVYDFNAGMADGADALLTLATPLPAGQYNLTFRIYQNYYGNPGHILGDFSLDYTTDTSPTLSSPQTPVSIQSASSLNGTTFSFLSPGELLANTSQNSLGIDTYTISASVDAASSITGIFLDAIKNPALPGGGPGGQYGNGNFVVSEFTLDASAGGSTVPFTVDTVTPTVTVSIDNSDVNVADGAGTVTFSFGEAPVAFSLADTSAVGGTLSNLQQVNATTYTATFTGAANTDINNASVSVTPGSWQEGNGNTGAGGGTTSFTVDTVTPTVTVSINNTDVNLANNTAMVTFSFSEAPTDFTLANVTATGGTLGPLTVSADGKTYTATFMANSGTDISNGSVSVDSTWHEANGNSGTGASSAAFVVDTVTPTALVAVNSSDVNLAHNTATVTFTFSEAPTDFSLAHTSTVGGTLGNLSGSGTTYTAVFTAAAGKDISNGSVSVDSTWHEANGNPGTGATTAAFVVDTVTPTVAVSINSTLNLAHNTATVTFTFSEAPVSFVLSDTSAVGGTLSNLQKINATQYTATFTATANTLINNASVSVTAGSWQEGNGNAGAAGSSGNFIVDTMDHWTNISGGKWTTASSWSNGVPSANVEAAVDTKGTYTVSITTTDTAYALLLNDSGATLSDNGGGALTLVGTGGSSNPNGVLAINAGTFALAGGVLKSGPISIASGGKLLVSASYTGLSNAIVDNGSITVSGKSSSFASNISGSGAINIQNGAGATFNGAITGSETFTITNTSKVIVNTTISGSGSFILSGSGSLEFGAADSENVTFTSGASGTVKFDHGLTAPFTGYLSGLSTKNAVDLADLAWSPGKMKATFSGNTSGGTLTVTNRTNSVALKLLGNYTTASWTLSKDSTGGTRVVDPPVTGSLSADANGGAVGGIDLSGISFGAHTTLAYSPSSDNTGGTLTVSDGLHAQNVALLGQYMASSFVMASDGHGGTLITDPPASQQQLLTHPHA